MEDDKRPTFREFIERTLLNEQMSNYQIQHGFERLKHEARTRKDLSPGDKLIIEGLILLYEHQRKQ
jgi:hypothetical protein